ncbi:MAG: hypothetical protein M3Y13_00480 [Armatimonadota bacterium]|nr:hypothetical protein [Armatimonadota bacterium]
MAFSVLFGAMAARMAGARRVSCVNQNYRYPCRFRLVTNKLPQLVKRPIAEKPAHLPSETVTALSDIG